MRKTAASGTCIIFFNVISSLWSIQTHSAQESVDLTVCMPTGYWIAFVSKIYLPLASEGLCLKKKWGKKLTVAVSAYSQQRAFQPELPKAGCIHYLCRSGPSAAVLSIICE